MTTAATPVHFDDAVNAALRQASAEHTLPRRRHRARLAAAVLVVVVTYGARLAPVFDEDERYRNLVTALRPWRERLCRSCQTP